ncbi:MAG TPA: DUF2207 domain-containing protein [Acidimicrobiales bacterium]
MHARNRRRLDKFLICGGAAAVGAVAVVGGLIGDNERIQQMWVSAEVQPDGSARVVEVIDYDFGSLARNKHGIYRVIPGLTTADQITVTSDAPDDVSVASAFVEGESAVNVRIGNPAQTVSGEHRYMIEYRLPDVMTDEGVDWDAIGTAWEVPIERAEIHLAAPVDFPDPQCFVGGVGSTDRCDVRQTEPGRLTVEHGGLDDHEGLSLEARSGSRLDATPGLPGPPLEAPDDPGTGLLPPGGTAVAALVVAALPTVAVIRRAGRERMAPGGAADAAFAGQGGPPGGPGDGPGGAGGVPPGPWAAPGAGAGPAGAPAAEVLVDHEELAALATTEFAPPEGLTPAQGGIVLTERVQREHKTAWLIQAAIDGAVELEDRGANKFNLVRKGPGTPEQARFLDRAFGKRQRITLGTYDKRFAKAWAKLDGDLELWRKDSGLWDERAGARRIPALVLGIVVGVIGTGLVGLGGLGANRWGAGWLALVAIGGLVAGAGITTAITSWELRVRTAAGSAAWLRVESFRRFLAASEAYHAEEAAKRGLLREYTAWAVALGEIDRWSRAVKASTAIPEDAGLGYVHMAPQLVTSTTRTATAPSSSGGGGGGGFSGSVGGGAGGGGGGSW